MKTVDVSRRYRFSASHRLHVGSLSDQQNQLTFGKCNNPHGHGHNYTLEVTVGGPIDRDTGMVVNLPELDTMVKQHVLERFDLENLNHDAAFQLEVSSTENLCRVAWGILIRQQAGARLGTAKLKRVRIEETSNNFFEYTGRE